MAAVSAGAIQTGFLSESIAQPSPQLQQQQQQQHHHSEEQLQYNASSIGSSSFVGQQTNFVQRINVENYLIAKQQTAYNNNPNVAPGWRRQLSEGEIIYYSPSGTALRKIEQIKEYLLRHDTCKCGLPCPLRPDFFFEFNPQVPNSPLQIPPEHASNPTPCCLHIARFVEQHNLLTNEIEEPKDFSHCLSSNRKSSIDAVLKTNLDGSSSQDAVYSEASDSPENQVESVTVSRTPPWRKNSILNQQPQQQSTQQNMLMAQSVDNINVPTQDNRVPPLPQQHLVQLQPPWHNETQKRRNISKKRLNFKEDPTGYLNHQTAILHSSILNVHSPELHDAEMVSTVPLHSYRQSPNLINRSSPHLSTDVVNTVSDLNFQNDAVGDDHDHDQQQMSMIQQQQQNQNVYIQQINSSGVPKDQMVVVSDGQPIRVLQNSAPIIYSNASGEIALNSLNVSPQISQSPVKLNELIVGGKRVQHNLQNQQIQVQIQEKSDYQVSRAHTVSAKEATTQKAFVVAQIDQDAGGINKETNENPICQPIDVTHSPNAVNQVQHNCDINQVKSQTQTILMKSKLNDHKYILPQRQSILTKVVSAPQESPVSSSTANKAALLNNQATTNDTRGPSQVETISTSHESPPSSSPDTSASPESSSAMNDSHINVTNKSQASLFVAGQTSGKNTITSVLAGKAMTSTTTSNQFKVLNNKDRSNAMSGNFVQIHENRILKSAPSQQSVQTTNRQLNNITVNINAATAAALNIKTSNNQNNQTIVQDSPSPVPAQTSLPNIQIQQPANQIIMTSSGCQILVMPTQNTKTSNQMIIGHQPTNASALVVNNGTGQQNVVLNQQNAHMIGNDIIQGINDSTMGGHHHHHHHNAATNILQNTGNSVVIQSPNLIQPSNNVITANNANTNYIVSSPNAIQPMIINNSNLLSHNGNVLHQPNQNVIQANANSMLTTANTTKVISNAGNLLSPSNILTNQSSVLATNNQFISSNNSGSLLSPNNNSIVLNQLSNASYVIQPQSFATVDGQVVNVINSDGVQNQFVQQTQTQRIILSPDSKRRVKKRKNSSVSPQNLSAQQSPTLQSPPQQTTVLQIAPQYHQSHHQSFQTTSIEQQILLQNGQTILQPLNLIGQQLLVPAGLMMTSDTVLQIQNVAPCSLITPQGVVQNKSFLSPNSANQQFIVSGNGQISPIGQMYSTLVVPQSLHTPQSNGPTFVQQSTTIVQQQTTMMNNSSGGGGGSGSGSSNSSNAVNETDTISINVPQSVSTQTNSHTVHTVTSSPPDTTTHSPRSPERPESQRSIASDINMVQFVSSSEPDSVVSPATESAQSPSGDYDRITNISYTMGSMYKPNEAKLRRIQAVTQFTNNENTYKMKADSHEASSPLSSASVPTTASNSASTSQSIVGTCSSSMFSVGNLVWGAVRGHTAWPGKIVPAPDADKSSQSESTCWVRWFGGKPSIELVQISSLKSLSEGLEAHHKAQKDNRKSRKLNSQLEKAIQEAMAELDQPSLQPTSTTTAITTTSTTSVTSANVLRSKPVNVPSSPLSVKSVRTRVTRASAAKERKIAPAPPNNGQKTFHV